MPQSIDFRSAEKIPGKRYAPYIVRRDFGLWERLENYGVALPFLFNYVDNVNMYFASFFGSIAACIHGSSSPLANLLVVAVFQIAAFCFE
jgi:hypothetical protein